MENNRKDIDELLSYLNENSGSDIIFCRHSLDKNRILALIKNSNDFDFFYFDMEYIKDTSLRIQSSDVLQTEKEFFKGFKKLLRIIPELEKLEFNSKKIGVPEYYYNISKDGKISISLGWYLNKEKKEKTLFK